MNKALLLFSGGIDSTIVLYWALHRGWELIALSFDYPYHPKEEKKAARRIIKNVNIELIEAKLPFLRNIKDLNIKRPDSKGVSNSPGLGYIPMRNMIFYAIAGYYAEIHEANHIIAGHTEEDAKTYSDNSNKFFQLIESAYKQTLSGSFISNNKKIKIILPLIGLSDDDTIKLGKDLGVPFHLTWSCWNDVEFPCRKCFACKQRELALSSNGLD